MRDRRLISLLVVVLVVVTVSFILVSFWGYRYYFEKKEAQRTIVVKPKQATDAGTSFSDSLQNLLDLAANQLQVSSDSISLDSTSDTALASKLVEFNRLRNEITEMIRDKDASQNSAAENERINQLQQSLEALKTRNDEVAAENERLANMVKQLMQTKGKPAPKSGKHLARSAYTLPVLVAHLRFVGMSLSDNKSITNIAAKTERLYGSFEINIKPTNKDNTIYIVIVQPDGKTLITPTERSGTFKTHSGTKPFTTSIKFDNKRDNGNRLVFTIDSHNFQKGTYAMQIYHQGVMIGRLTRTLF